MTYNVNSISTRLERVLHLIEAVRPDVVCLQETKVSEFPALAFETAGYLCVDHSRGGSAGVAVLARTELGIEAAHIGLADGPLPDQARWVEAVVDGITVVAVYVPNGQSVGSEAFGHKLAFFEAMRVRAAELARGPTVIAGDLNVCPTDLDVWDVTQVHGATHVTDDERQHFHDILAAGYVDAFRARHSEEPGFTWWDYRAGHFHKGFGLRIDFVLAGGGVTVDEAVVERSYRKPSTVPGTKPSDHAPLIVDFHMTG